MPGAINQRSAMLTAGLLAAGLACGAGAFLLIHSRESPAHAGQQLPYTDIQLVDQNGNDRTVSFWSGRLIVLDFIFAGCGDICPIKTGQLADVQQALDPALRDHVQFVSVSIDPEHDTSAALQAYANRNGADLSNWAFLTGDLAKVARIAAAFDAQLENDSDAATHITTIWLLDGSGRVLQHYTGEPVDQMRLLRDIAARASERSTQQAPTRSLP